MKRLLVLAALLFVLPAHAEVTIEWITVGDPGNACDPHPFGCYGAVDYTYRIGKYEVTSAQYAEFLNAVAATDTYGLYTAGFTRSVIGRSGSPGSYTYSAIAGREEMPVNWVSSYDAMRFANWLHNGQPTGAQDSTTTEDGAYTMIMEDYPDEVIARNSGATFFLTSEHEWHKAAYYDAGSTSYFDYPAGSDTQITCAVPTATANRANCGSVGDLTDVGSYTGSASPYGTFDQGGNAKEWNEAITDWFGDWVRLLRGGSFEGLPSSPASAAVSGGSPALERSNIGFRVASPVSAPPVPSLSPVGVALLGGLVFGIGTVGMGLAARRRRG